MLAHGRFMKNALSVSDRGPPKHAVVVRTTVPLVWFSLQATVTTRPTIGSSPRGTGAEEEEAVPGLDRVPRFTVGTCAVEELAAGWVASTPVAMAETLATGAAMATKGDWESALALALSTEAELLHITAVVPKLS